MSATESSDLSRRAAHTSVGDGLASVSTVLRIALITLASDHGIRGELSLIFGRRAELRQELRIGAVRDR